MSDITSTISSLTRRTQGDLTPGTTCAIRVRCDSCHQAVECEYSGLIDGWVLKPHTFPDTESEHDVWCHEAGSTNVNHLVMLTQHLPDCPIITGARIYFPCICSELVWSKLTLEPLAVTINHGMDMHYYTRDLLSQIQLTIGAYLVESEDKLPNKPETFRRIESMVGSFMLYLAANKHLEPWNVETMFQMQRFTAQTGHINGDIHITMNVAHTPMIQNPRYIFDYDCDICHIEKHLNRKILTRQAEHCASCKGSGIRQPSRQELEHEVAGTELRLIQMSEWLSDSSQIKQHPRITSAVKYHTGRIDAVQRYITRLTQGAHMPWLDIAPLPDLLAKFLKVNSPEYDFAKVKAINELCGRRLKGQTQPRLCNLPKGHVGGCSRHYTTTGDEYCLECDTNLTQLKEQRLLGHACTHRKDVVVSTTVDGMTQSTRYTATTAELHLFFFNNESEPITPFQASPILTRAMNSKPLCGYLLNATSPAEGYLYCVRDSPCLLHPRIENHVAAIKAKTDMLPSDPSGDE